ncbi:hypothetical protein [Nocardioides sp.]|uniref:hypothetical protein n=1 Tax=Nocardioides sp. TaxID=35761 RepID=UPI002B276DB3|nr:hypothetical protein [Nocardioides sp.]
MTHPPHPFLRRSIGAVKCTIVAVLAFLAVSATSAPGALGTDAAVAQEVLVAPAGEDRLERLLQRHDCSATGFGVDVIPGSSLVLQDDEVRHVSFDDGWDVYTGAQPGTLLAVCRASV